MIDDEKGHPDLLGKKELGRELEIKGIVTLFHRKNNQLPSTIIITHPYHPLKPDPDNKVLH